MAAKKASVKKAPAKKTEEPAAPEMSKVGKALVATIETALRAKEENKLCSQYHCATKDQKDAMRQNANLVKLVDEDIRAKVAHDLALGKEIDWAGICLNDQDDEPTVELAVSAEPAKLGRAIETVWGYARHVSKALDSAIEVPDEGKLIADAIRKVVADCDEEDLITRSAGKDKIVLAPMTLRITLHPLDEQFLVAKMTGAYTHSALGIIIADKLNAAARCA